MFFLLYSCQVWYIHHLDVKNVWVFNLCSEYRWRMSKAKQEGYLHSCMKSGIVFRKRKENPLPIPSSNCWTGMGFVSSYKYIPKFNTWNFCYYPLSLTVSSCSRVPLMKNWSHLVVVFWDGNGMSSMKGSSFSSFAFDVLCLPASLISLHLVVTAMLM